MHAERWVVAVALGAAAGLAATSDDGMLSGDARPISGVREKARSSS